jgi:hypothetical protein
VLKMQDQSGSPYSSVRAGATLVTDVFDRLRQLGCGHTEVFRFERDRMWLECLKCGRQSPGLVTTKSAAVGTVRPRLDWIRSAVR